MAACDEKSTKLFEKNNVPEEFLSFKLLEFVQAEFTFLIENREALLHAQLINNVVIDSFESGKISMKISENCSFDVVKHLSKFLQDKTGLKWVIEEVQKTNNKTHEENKDIYFEKKKKEIGSDPIINEVKQLFPNAEIKDIE